MNIATFEPVHPNADDIRAADAALASVQSYLNAHPDDPAAVPIRLDDGAELVLPRAAVELFARILAFMATGHGVSVVPAEAELTTQQAADLLNVSRPYLIGLLDADAIEYRKVGKHRRVKAASLLAYLRADDRRRRAAADELSALTREMGLG